MRANGGDTQASRSWRDLRAAPARCAEPVASGATLKDDDFGRPPEHGPFVPTFLRQVEALDLVRLQRASIERRSWSSSIAGKKFGQPEFRTNTGPQSSELEDVRCFRLRVWRRSRIPRSSSRCDWPGIAPGNSNSALRQNSETEKRNIVRIRAIRAHFRATRRLAKIRGTPRHTQDLEEIWRHRVEPDLSRALPGRPGLRILK